MTVTRRVVPIAVAATETVSLYASEEKIQPRTVHGWFASWRWTLVWLTQLVFYGLPWLQWNGRPALLFDLAARRFYIFAMVLHPQDVIYLAGLLIISAFGLFLFTAVAGRLWCGFACPQTVYTEIFMWVEQALRRRSPGADQARSGAVVAAKAGAARRQASRLAGDRPVDRLHLRRLLHAGTSARRRGDGLLARPVGNVLVALLRPGHLRQRRLPARAGVQVHVPVCALPERDVRPRHADRQLRPAARRAARLACRAGVDPASIGKGDCIDCTLCVQVCPTGIDIREGLQYECIGCAACIDVCNGVMDKMEYPRGLIRFATQNAMSQRWSTQRSCGSASPARACSSTAPYCWRSRRPSSASLATRSPFKADVVRDRGALARMVEDGRVENVYRLQLMNATEQPQRLPRRRRGPARRDGPCLVRRRSRGDRIALGSGRRADPAAGSERASPGRPSVRLPHQTGRLGRRRRRGRARRRAAREIHLHRSPLRLLP